LYDGGAEYTGETCRGGEYGFIVERGTALTGAERSGYGG
jgi:hypothetical protein